MTSMTTELPHDYNKSDTGLIEVINEEESAVWLWADPGLMLWPNQIVWVDSPVTGKDPHPGDLWGVDEQGELLIVEGKYLSTSDPFIDFVDFYHHNRAEFLSKTIRERWQKLYSDELKFGDNGYDERLDGKTPGILPRSSKRVCLRRWKALTTKIDENIRSDQYRNQVIKFLSIREEKGNPQPHFWGLLVHGKHGLPKLSTQGEDSMSGLGAEVGKTTST